MDKSTRAFMKKTKLALTVITIAIAAITSGNYVYAAVCGAVTYVTITIIE